MRTILLIGGALVSSAVLMAWGFIFWTFSPAPGMVMQNHSAMDSVVATLQTNDLPRGVFYYPAPEVMAENPRGPFVQLLYVPHVQYMAPSTLVQGFLHMFGTALLVGMMLRGFASALPNYGSRVAASSMIGLISVFAIHFSNPIWFHYPWSFAFVVATYDFVMFLLIGLIMAAVIRPIHDHDPQEDVTAGEEPAAE